MGKDITVSEFCAIITERLLLDSLGAGHTYRNTFHPTALTISASYVLRDVLSACGFEDLRVIRGRNDRLWLRHAATRRIICEVGVVSDRLPDGLRVRPWIALLDRKALISPGVSFNKLVERAAVSRGNVPQIRRNYGGNPSKNYSYHPR